MIQSYAQKVNLIQEDHSRSSKFTSIHLQFIFCFELLSVSSVTQSCLTLCDPMDCSMPGFPVRHRLLELAQTHVHQVSDAMQPSHPLLSPYPAFNLSQHESPVQRSRILLLLHILSVFIGRYFSKVLYILSHLVFKKCYEIDSVITYILQETNTQSQ